MCDKPLRTFVMQTVYIMHLGVHCLYLLIRSSVSQHPRTALNVQDLKGSSLVTAQL